MAQSGENAANASASAPAAPVRKSRLRRWGRRVVTILVVLYLIAGVMLAALQSYLIFPGAFVHGRQTAQVLPAPGREILALHTANGKRIGAIFGGALNADGSARDDAAQCPTILYFYGNGDCVQTSLEQFVDFRKLGANVLIPEYVGYPMSEGKPGEAGFYATADAAYQYLLTRKDVDPSRIIVVGRSIGSGAAIDLASRKPVAGLATFSAFTSMDEMARKVLPLFPTGLFLRTHFRNEQKIAAVKCPIFLAHGTHDSLVPFKMMGRLAAKATAPVTVVPVDGADHNDIFLVGGQSLLDRFGEFVEAIHSRHAGG